MFRDPELREFESWRSYWDFAYEVKHRSRHYQNSRVNTFLNTLLNTSEKRTKTMMSEQVFWRSQIGHLTERISCNDGASYKKPLPYSKERMYPLPERAKEGRANPKGIPFLYMATDAATAISESRAWPGVILSVGKFVTKRSLRIIDCRCNPREDVFYFDEPSPSEKEEAVWQCVNIALSEPVTHSDDVADYAPTQMIAETFANEVADGIIYSSFIGNGSNLVLFGVDDVECEEVSLYQVSRINVEFEPLSNPYFQTKVYRHI
jgi:hypothetical protein